MLANFSPEKENRSPSPRKKLFQKQLTKTSGIIQELTALLNSHQITIPQHLNLNQDQNGFQLMKANDIDPQEFAKIKARLADKEFEVKRLDEDFAEFKLLSRLDHQKAVKKLKDEIKTIQSKHSEEVKKWETNYTQTVNKYENQKQAFLRQTQQHYKNLTQKAISELQLKHSKQIHQLEKQLQQVKKERKETVQNMVKQYDHRIIVIKQTHQTEVETLNQKHKEEVVRTQQKFDAKVLAVECQKNAEVKQAQQKIENTFKKEEKYLRQIGILERDKNNLFEKQEDTQMKLKVMTKKYEDLGKTMENLKKEHGYQLQQVENRLRRTKKQTQNIIEFAKLNILKENYEKTQNIQKRYKNLEEIKDLMKKDYENNQKLINQRFDRRQSRKEDVEIIKQIEYRLIEKEKQATMLYDHLKYFQLEKQNNDKIYTKIFSSHREKKGGSSRPDRDIFSILKQSNTTDMRHLLKITKKQSKK